MKLENLPEPPEFLKRARSKGREEGREEGRLQGRGEDVLAVLAARGVPVPPEVRDRILACRDADLLSAWLVRAVRVDRAEAIFEIES